VAASRDIPFPGSSQVDSTARLDRPTTRPLGVKQVRPRAGRSRAEEASSFLEAAFKKIEQEDKEGTESGKPRKGTEGTRKKSLVSFAPFCGRSSLRASAPLRETCLENRQYSKTPTVETFFTTPRDTGRSMCC
jgi:hypothetical protein